MGKSSVADISLKLYQLLEQLTAEERGRAVHAALVLFGESVPALQSPAGAGTAAPAPKAATNVAAFFDSKSPANKGEVLAVAARYREINQNQDLHSKDDLRKVVSDARRNFDGSNFTRDIKNAKHQAGFFNLGTKKDSNQLSYYGQQYVDALPDREAATKLKRPKVGRAKRPGSKKK